MIRMYEFSMTKMRHRRSYFELRELMGVYACMPPQICISQHVLKVII